MITPTERDTKWWDRFGAGQLPRDEWPTPRQAANAVIAARTDAAALREEIERLQRQLENERHDLNARLQQFALDVSARADALRRE